MTADGDSDRLRREVVNAFKLHGFTLKNEAMQKMLEWMGDFQSAAERRELLDRTIGQIQKLPCSSLSPKLARLIFSGIVSN